jgi:hypothetical protein
MRELSAGGSYLSASPEYAYFGLSAAAAVDEIEVVWPSGRRERWRDIVAGPRVRLHEGTGAP